MPFHSQLNQGNDLLRQFFTTLVPGFGPAKEQEFQNKIGKVKRIPGMSIQEGLSFQTNKASIFTPEFNGSGPFPFFFGNGYMPPSLPGSPGGESGDAGSPDDPSGGPWYPPPGGDQDPDGPPVPEPESSTSGSSSLSGSDSTSGSESGSGSDIISTSTGGGSESGSTIITDVEGGNEDTGEPTTVVVEALTSPDTEIIDGNA